MLLMLQRRGRMTARQLAIELEVSPRTVLRDVDALSGAGVPIFTVQGVHGGIELTSGFRTELTGVTMTEAAALLLAGQPLIAERLGLAIDAAAVRRKLIEALPAEQRDVAERLDRWFLHDLDGDDRDRVLPDAPRQLAEAITSCVAVELTFGAGPSLVTQPLGLVLSAGDWYLVIHDGSQVTTRSLRDLRAVHVTRRRFAPPDGFDVRAFWSEHSLSRAIGP
jgi:predicted DNA-binding transcriptional regulator YafY